MPDPETFTIAAEKTIPQEKLPTPDKTIPVPTPQPQVKNDDQPVPPIPVVTPPKVVNKTTAKEKLHNVDKNADAITSLADQEEEKFIEEVEKIHSNPNEPK